MHHPTILSALAFASSLICSGAAPSDDYPSGFGPMRNWTPVADFCLPGQPVEVGDFNGDGMDDVVCFYKGTYSDARFGDVMVSLSNGGGFLVPQRWHDFYSGTTDEVSLAGDFNGDGRDDLVNLHLPLHEARVNLSTGTGFPTSSLWSTAIISPGQLPLIGDFNGDGRDDVAILIRGATPHVWVSLSTGTAFAPLVRWQTNFCPGTALPAVGDFNGDGKDDLVCFIQATAPAPARGDVIVTLSTGASFATPAEWASGFGFQSGSTMKVTDLNGDGWDDIIEVYGNGLVLGSLNTGSGFSAPAEESFLGIWSRHPKARLNSGEIPLTGYFNRDLTGDLAMCTLNLRPVPDTGRIYVSLGGGHAVPEPESRLAEFGYGRMGDDPTRFRVATGSRPLIVFLLNYASNLPWQRTVADYDQLFFGPSHPNMAAYFSEMSGGQFTWHRAGPGLMVLDFVSEDKTPTVGAVYDRAAELGFDFRPYDTNGDGIVESAELGIVTIANIPTAHPEWAGWGQTVGPWSTVHYPSGPSIVMGIWRAGAGDGGAWDVYAHELSHTLRTEDLYGYSCYNEDVSLMHCNGGPEVPSKLVHLDAWHKMRLGWLKPRLIDSRFPGAAWIKVAQTATGSANPPILLFNGGRTNYAHEYRLLEYRKPNFDGGVQTWTAGGGTWRVPTPPNGGYRRGGYDVNAPGPYGGLLNWYVGTQGTHELVADRVGIRPDEDGTLESVRAGDDVQIGGNIWWGPDGILQSVEAPTDGGFQDVRLFPALDPRDLADRRTVEYWPLDQSEEAPTMRWMDGADTGLHVRDVFRRSSAPASFGVADSLYVEWGPKFRPFLNARPVGATPLLSGTSVLQVFGELGSDRFNGIFANNEEERYAPRASSGFSAERRDFEVPYGLPPGTYRFFLRSRTDEAANAISNAIRVEIKNPLFAWRETYGVDSAASDFWDTDRDGRVDLLEAVQGSNPRVIDQPGQNVIVSRVVTPRPSPLPPLVSRRIQLHYQSFDCIRVDCEISTDLANWTVATPDGPPVLDGKGGSMITVTLAGDGPQLFARLRVGYEFAP